MGGLESLLIRLGGNLLPRMVAGRFGPMAGEATKMAIEALADAFGVEASPRAVEDAILATPTPEATTKVAWAEDSVSERLKAQAEVMREGNRQLEITTAALPSVQSGEPAWTWAWLYVWQWLLMAVWAWTLIGVHVANAGLRLLGSGDGAPLPAPDLGVLMSLTTLYMGLHMGGHTVLELMRGRWGGVFERGKGGPA